MNLARYLYEVLLLILSFSSLAYGLSWARIVYYEFQTIARYTLFFYKRMNFLAEAFAKQILCLFFTTKAFMCLKIWPKPFCAYDVLKFKND